MIVAVVPVIAVATAVTDVAAVGDCLSYCVDVAIVVAVGVVAVIAALVSSLPLWLQLSIRTSNSGRHTQGSLSSWFFLMLLL